MTIQLVLENAASIVIAAIGLVTAIVLLALRSWLPGLLIGLGSLLDLAASLASVAFTLVLGLLIQPGVDPDRARLVENVYLGGENVLGTIAMALLVAGALLAIRGRRARAPRPVHARFGVGLAAVSVVSLGAAVVLGASALLNAPRAMHAVLPTATPTPTIDPGTYSAGKLRAPRSLGGSALSPPGSDKDARDARQARDRFSSAVGGTPAIHATYGFLTILDAAQGYLSPDAYFGGSKVEYSTYGQVRCGTAGVSICIRSDQSQQLTVVVSDLAAPDKVAAMVDEAWRDEGGH